MILIIVELFINIIFILLIIIYAKNKKKIEYLLMYQLILIIKSYVYRYFYNKCNLFYAQLL